MVLTVCGMSEVLWGYTWRSVEAFSDKGGIGRADIGGGGVDYMYGLKCESRCLFSCRHLDNISDFLFIYIYIYIYIYTHTHTHVHIYIYTHTHTHIYIHAHTHIYIHTHTRIDIYIHTHV